MTHWYQSPYNNRHPKVKEATKARGKNGPIDLDRGTIVQPIRQKYLSRHCWIHDMIWSEAEHAACHTEKHGMLLVLIRDIDFSKK